MNKSMYRIMSCHINDVHLDVFKNSFHINYKYLAFTEHI